MTDLFHDAFAEIDVGGDVYFFPWRHREEPLQARNDELLKGILRKSKNFLLDANEKKDWISIDRSKVATILPSCT